MSLRLAIAILAFTSLVIVKYGLIDQIRLNRQNQSIGTLPYKYYVVGLLAYMITVWQAGLTGDIVTSTAQFLGVLLFVIILAQWYRYTPDVQSPLQVSAALLAIYLCMLLCYLVVPGNMLLRTLALLSIVPSILLKLTTLQAILKHWETQSTAGLSAVYIALTLLSLGFGGAQSVLSSDWMVAFNQWSSLALSIVIVSQMYHYRGRTPLSSPRNARQHPVFGVIKFTLERG